MALYFLRNTFVFFYTTFLLYHIGYVGAQGGLGIQECQVVNCFLFNIKLYIYLRMYWVDTEALVFMFNGGSSYSFTIHPIFTRISAPGKNLRTLLKGLL